MARKIPEGEYRNKARTMRKLIDAVGEILQNEGYSKLGVNHIASVAGVSKKLIYRYFTTADNLIETYIREMDFWDSIKSDTSWPTYETHDAEGDRYWQTLKRLLIHFNGMPDTHKILHWQISGKIKVMKEAIQLREQHIAKLLQASDRTFAETGIDFRAIFVLLMAGIHYLHINAKGTGDQYCELDINTNEGMQRILDGIKTVIDLCHNEAAEQMEYMPQLFKVKGG